MEKLVTIGDLTKSLNLIDPKNKKPLNYILRYWEKEFKQIKPKIINKRRYYSSNQVKTVKLIHFLLKNKGLTIKGVKKILSNLDTLKLDENLNESIKAHDIRNKLVKISNMIKSLKNNK